MRPQARPETQALVSLFRYFAGAAAEVKGAVLPAGDGQLQYTRRQQRRPHFSSQWQYRRVRRWPHAPGPRVHLNLGDW